MKILNISPIKFILFAFIIVVTVFTTIFYFNRPTPSKSIDLPILIEADKYAVQVANYDFKKAKKYSTPENNKILNSQIKTQMNNIARQNGMAKLKIKQVTFEKSLLVNEDPNHQIVAEKMVYDTPKLKNQVIYLRFEIIKTAKTYQISNTTLIIIKELDKN